MRVATLTLLACLGALGQDVLPQDQGISGLAQTMRRLASPFRVLHIVAHPDDEDGPTLTYLSRGLGAEVVIASVTRGESGANLVTGDFFDALGILRTLEFRKSAQYYGADLRFTRFTDFGYSKTLGETLSKWDRDEVTRDLVAIIREVRPHIVLSRFQGGPPDGHGHHQAAGLLAQEAYRAAGDSSRYPDVGQPWRPFEAVCQQQARRPRLDGGDRFGPVRSRSGNDLRRNGALGPALPALPGRRLGDRGSRTIDSALQAVGICGWHGGARGIDLRPDRSRAPRAAWRRPPVLPRRSSARLATQRDACRTCCAGSVPSAMRGCPLMRRSWHGARLCSRPPWRKPWACG